MMPRNHNRSESGNICVVCCEDIEIFAVGQCDHPICYVCSVRMRFLGKEKYCAVCRTDMDKVLLTKKCGKWSTLQDQLKHCFIDKEAGLCYADKDVRNKVNELLQHKCPKCLDPPLEKTFNKLRDHMKREHRLYFCDICLKHLQKFTQELKVYSRTDLAKHRRLGDLGDKAYKGHPLCEFCDERFLDDEYLHRHLRKNHFWCHICEKDGKQLYFQDYVNLRDHFREEHYLCEEDMCKYEQYTSVFRSEIDLQAHVALKHSQKMTKAQVRQARQLEVDLVFNRPPPQGRNITGQDYNEVQAGEQRFRRNRGNRRNTANTRQEEQNVRAAVESSPVKKEDNNSSSHQNKTTENPVIESKQAVLPEDDFPLLRGEIPAPKTSQNNSPKASPKSSRKTEAYIKKAKGLNNLEDFPVLGGNSSKTQQNEAGNNVPNSSQYSPKSTKKNESSNKKPKGLNSLEDFPTLGKPSKAQQNVRKDVKLNAQISPKTTRKPETGLKKKPLDNNGDFPTLGQPSNPQQTGPAASDQSTSISKPAKRQEVADKKSKAFDNLDDFPSLGKPSKSQPKNPPPGFANVAKKATEPSQMRPPPGFMLNMPQPQQSAIENDPQSNTQFSVKVDDILLPKEKPKAVTNIEKKDNKLDVKSNQSRNQNLIENIKALLEYDVEKFLEFKQLSGKFRQGQCSAEAYYNDCTALFGLNFSEIFNELVTLLPDQDKQEELLKIHNDAKVVAKQNGKPLQQGNGKKVAARDSAWGPLQSSSAPVKPVKEALQRSRSEAEFPSLPPAAPRQMKPPRIYKPTNNLALKSAWVRGK